jgi:6-phosphogluconolactonase (cycloisomerase 2 family)
VPEAQKTAMPLDFNSTAQHLSDSLCLVSIKKKKRFLFSGTYDDGGVHSRWKQDSGT